MSIKNFKLLIEELSDELTDEQLKQFPVLLRYRVSFAKSQYKSITPQTLCSRGFCLLDQDCHFLSASTTLSQIMVIAAIMSL